MPHAELEPGASLSIQGEEAHHARRVRRLDVGETVEILDGVGGVAIARIERCEKIAKREGWRLSVRVESVRRDEPLRPRIEVYSEPPKGHDLERMIDQLSQLGAARWSPLICDRSEVSPRDGKLDRLARIAQEASKQCGRAWFLEIGSAIRFEDALRAPDGSRVLVCHMSGSAYRVGADGRTVRLLVGPVGDLSERELDLARASNAEVASFGPLVMRIETACCAAGAVVMACERAP